MFKTGLFRVIAVGLVYVGIGLSFPHDIKADTPSGRVVLHYLGPHRIPAILTFQRNGDNYKTSSVIKVPFYRLLFRASGIVQGNKLRPIRYTDTRKGKLYAQAKFSDTSVTFGKVKHRAKIRRRRGPTFDAFSLTWYLALNDGELPRRSFITNAKKIYPLSGIKKMSDGVFVYNNKKIATHRYYVKRRGNKIEYDFAPSLNNIPVKVIYHNKGKSYTFRLQKVETSGNIMDMADTTI